MIGAASAQVKVAAWQVGVWSKCGAGWRFPHGIRPASDSGAAQGGRAPGGHPGQWTWNFTSRLTSCKPRYNCPVLSCLLASHNHRFPYPSPSSTNHQELISSNTNNNKWYVMFFFLLPCPQLEYNKLIQLFQAPLSTIALVLGSLTAGGGITGFVRTGSIPSVVAGVTVGSLVRCPLRFFLLLSSCPYLSTSYLFQLLANDPALKSICLVASASATTRRTAPSSRCSPQSSSPEAPSLGPSGRGSHCRLD